MLHLVISINHRMLHVTIHINHGMHNNNLIKKKPQCNPMRVYFLRI